jgi:hypothetical protein
LIVRSFPERFSRKADGILVAVDLRPVVFSRQFEDRLRLGFTMNLPLAAPRRGRVQLSASHSVLFESQLQVADGAPFLDLLARDGSSGGTTPARHQSELSFGHAEPGLGIRLNGEHRGRSFLGENASGRELVFDPLLTVSIRGFVKSSRLGIRPKLLRNLRFGLTVSNLLNRREKVRDSNGQTPLLYQQNRRDPSGRSIEFKVRRAF